MWVTRSRLRGAACGPQLPPSTSLRPRQILYVLSIALRMEQWWLLVRLLQRLMQRLLLRLMLLMMLLLMLLLKPLSVRLLLPLLLRQVHVASTLLPRRRLIELAGVILR